MNTMSVPRAAPPGIETAKPRVLVWDVPLRLFHWLMVACFAGAWLTAETEAWRQTHVTLGFTMAGLVVFRLIWGIVGTRYARFSSFVRGPQAVFRYVITILRGCPEHHIGHNPLAALAVVALLGMSAIVIASGWAVYKEIPGKWLEEAHELAAGVMLAIVCIHIAGVLFSSWLHRENLIGAMLKGSKPGRPEQAIRRPWHSVAVLMVVAVVGFWWLQWQDTPTEVDHAGVPAAWATHGHHRHGRHGDDDD